MASDDPTKCSRCGYGDYVCLPKLDGVPICKSCLSKHRYPRWPRGRYNGQRIVGFSVKFKCDVTVWRWIPMIRIGELFKCCHWLCFYVWFEDEYADEMFIK
jgi:hypothetical protein